MRKNKLFCNLLIFLSLVSITVISQYNLQASAVGDYCYKYTGKALEASYDYLNSFYIEKHPDFALSLHYGSPSDIRVIKDNAKKITTDSVTDKQKASAIVKWVSENIIYYADSSCQFSIDVLINREADCLGYAYLISDMMKSIGIPAVVFNGYTGDMVGTVDDNFIKYSNYPGHAWVVAYINNSWLLYDPLFHRCEISSLSEISKWYFVTDIEGVMPYYKGINYSLQNSAVIYKNGKFYVYSDKGIITDGSFEKSIANNIAYDFTPISRYIDDSGCNDGYKYMTNNERQAKMVNGECYADGWVNYCDMIYRYMQPNGVYLSKVIIETNGEYYYESLKLKGDVNQYFLYNGIIVVYDNEIIPFELMNYSDIINNGGSVKFNVLLDSDNCEGFGKIKIDKKGRITVIKEGCIDLEIIALDKNRKILSKAIVGFYATNSTNYADCEYNRHVYKTTSFTDSTYKASGTAIKKCVKCGKKINVKTDERKQLKKITKLKVKNITETSVTLYWNKITGAEKYKVYYSTNGKKWKSVTTTKTSVTVKKLSSGTNYQFKVKAYAGKYYGENSSTIKTATKVKKVTLSSVKSAKKTQIAVTWKAVTGASGYVVEYSTSKKFKNSKTVTVKKGTSKKTTLKKLKSGKTYYVRVKAYKTVNGKAVYGSVSAVKTVKVK